MKPFNIEMCKMIVYRDGLINNSLASGGLSNNSQASGEVN